MAAGLLVACSSPSDGDVVLQQSATLPSLSEVRTTGKFILAEMAISKMGTIEDLKLDEAQGLRQQAAAVWNKLKVGDRKGAWSYNTYLRAGIDLSSLSSGDMKVDTAGRTVTLTLPPVVVEMAGRDAQMREEHYRVTGLRSNISASERAALKEQMNTHLHQEIKNNPAFVRTLTSRARQRATIYFDSLFSTCGYTTTIKFK